MQARRRGKEIDYACVRALNNGFPFLNGVQLSIDVRMQLRGLPAAPARRLRLRLSDIIGYAYVQSARKSALCPQSIDRPLFSFHARLSENEVFNGSMLLFAPQTPNPNPKPRKGPKSPNF